MCQVAQPDAVTGCRMLRDDATDADLDVVGMGAEDEKINGRYLAMRVDSPLSVRPIVQLRSPP